MPAVAAQGCAPEPAGFLSSGSMRVIRHFLLVLSLCAAAGAAERSATDVAKDPDLEGRLAEARRLHLSSSSRSRAIAEEVLAEARRRGDARNEGAALVELGIALRRLNQAVAAAGHLRAALPLIEPLGERRLWRRALKEMGHTYWALGDAANATDYFQRALRASEEDNDIAGQADAVAGLSAVADDLRDAERKHALRLQALELAERAGDRARIATYASNLGNSHYDRKDYAAARACYTRALDISKELRDQGEIDDARVLLARVDIAEGRPADAERVLRELLPARRALRGRVKVTVTLVQLGRALRAQGRAGEAVALLDEAWSYAAELTSRDLRMEVLDGRVATFEALGRYPEAIQALRRRQEEFAAQAGEAAQKRSAELREVFAAERREAEIAQLGAAAAARAAELRAKEAELARERAESRTRAAELERARTGRYALAGGLGAGLLTLGALVALLRVRLAAERRIHAETRAARDAAERADRLKTRFLGIASHDIRGPLGNIANLAAMIRSEAPGGAATAEHLGLIGAEAQRVLRLVEDLVTTAALETGRLELRRAPTDLAEVVHAVIGSLQWQAAAKHQRIAFDAGPPGAGRITADAARLDQVVSNLVGNAIKFSPPGSSIDISLVRDGNVVRLAVRDQGCGIAPADMAQLFTPFARLANRPTAGESSHGLGLSIAFEIVNRHGGKLGVESRPGAGSVFTVELPADA